MRQSGVFQTTTRTIREDNAIPTPSDERVRMDSVLESEIGGGLLGQDGFDECGH
jgi:hypothetical protein